MSLWNNWPRPLSPSETALSHSAAMDTPRSEKTHVEVSEDDKAYKYAEARSAAPSVYEKGTPIEEVADLPPDGGRGWLVIFGCVIFSAATVGWGYVLESMHAER